MQTAANIASNLARITGTPSATTSTGSSSSKQRTHALNEKSISTLFATFRRRFGHRWSKTDEDDKARNLWLYDLRAQGLTDSDVRVGLTRTAWLDWPPSTGEFAKMCRPAPEELGLPAERDAFDECCRNQRVAQGERTWSHPAVQRASAEIPSWDLAHSRSARQAFNHAYHLTIQRWMAGEDMATDIPKAMEYRPIRMVGGYPVWLRQGLLTPGQRLKIARRLIAGGL